MRNTKKSVDLNGSDVIFAGSNIYWDGTKLTFDGPGASENDQRKQGVFFKWGSLVGVSPALTNGSTDYSINTAVYIPDYNSGSPSWSTTNIYPAWSSIPYVTDIVQSGDYFGNHLNTDAHNTDNSYAYWNAKKGDICRYISENGFGPGGNWRMPTLAECGAPINVSWSQASPNPAGANGWERLGTESWSDITSSMTAANDKYGTAVIANGGGKFYNGIFPAAGSRSGWSNDNGGLVNVGSIGFFWVSSNYHEDQYIVILSIRSTDVKVGTSMTYRANGQPIRCVKN
jgi:hypothetical protein